MEYKKTVKELDEILILLKEQITVRHEDAMALIREQVKDEAGILLLERMENEQQSLRNLAKRIEGFQQALKERERR